jgi:hypothetical protein
MILPWLFLSLIYWNSPPAVGAGICDLEFEFWCLFFYLLKLYPAAVYIMGNKRRKQIK